MIVYSLVFMGRLLGADERHARPMEFGPSSPVETAAVDSV